MDQTGKFLNTTTIKYALAGVVFGLLFPGVATITRILGMDLPISIASVVAVQSTDRLMWIINTAPVFLGLFAGLAGYRQARLERVNDNLVIVESELRNTQASLEQRVEERTTELTIANRNSTKRANQLKAIADIARAVVLNRDIEELLPQLTSLISERFGFYHVGIFLLDDKNEFAILRAANSQGGQKMLDRSHRLSVGGQGIVGHVTYSGNPRIAMEVGEDAVFFNNPDLPETRSELALPLRYQEQIIGALDIQSSEKNAFSREDLEIFSILADQVSIAIQNARLLEQAQHALQEAKLAASQLSGQAWENYGKATKARGYRYDGIRSEPLTQKPATEEAEDTFTIPVRLRGQKIGRLNLKTANVSHTWTEDETAIIEATAERVALAIDGARLLDEAQKRAARETFLSELAARLGASFQLDSILRDTVEELGQVLKGSTVTFQLVDPSSSPSADNGGSNTDGGKKSE